MEITDPVVVSFLGATYTALIGTITALWVRNGKLQEDKDKDRDEYSAKTENMIRDQVALLTKATEQTNTFSRYMENLTLSTAQFQKEILDKVSQLSLSILTGGKNG